MAKTTPKKEKTQGGSVEMPPNETIDPLPAESAPLEPADTMPPETTIEETANKEQLDRTTGARGQRKESGLGFFARLPKHQPADWEKLKLYLYRLAPITDRTAGGNPVKFLTIYREPIDEEMVLKEWGSGKYRCLLNRMQEKGESIPIDRVEFEIENMNFPPKVPPGEWVDDPRNRRWAWANKEGEQKNGAHPAAAPPPGAGPTLGEIVTAVKTMSDMTRSNQPPAPAKEESPFEKIDIVGLIDKTHSANDPVKMLAGFKDLADILKPPAAAPAADPVAMALKIIEALKPNTPAVAPLDPVAQMKVQLDMIKTIKDTFGDSEKEAAETRSRMNGWQEFFKEPLTELMSGLKPLFKVGADILFLKTNHPAPAANATPRATAPAQVAQPTQPGAPAPAAAPEQPAAEQPQGQEEPPMMNRQQAEAHMIMTGVASVAPTLIKYFESEELTGVDFASWFCDASLPTGLPNMPMVPELVDGYDALPMLKQYGAAQIQSLIKVNAGPLYTRIAPTEDKEAALLKFLEEFLSYDPEAEQPEAK